MNQSAPLTAYPVWDKATRWFHWINVLCVLGLIAVGVVILNGKALGVSGEGKILLKTVHVYIGYIFCANLFWRVIWGFIGNQYARWSAILPGGNFMQQLREYLQGAKSGDAPAYAGHNPMAKLMVAFLILLLLTMGVTGLVLAGTDVYMPPFGAYFADWVTAGDTEKLAQLMPGSKEFVDMASYKEMRAFRSPFIETHEVGFYVLLAAIGAHIAAVVITEVREGNGLVSAMFTGRKVFSKKPVDSDK
ncbi:MAG: cytochrome B [Zetaproteobacteria bacterium CG_4_9_14_3_um_filter_49_83]|nr:MAG: cytochrome B [Zetaproteobacteria bacterium CG1_02_49_23]PIQ32548.1 MAG: cytochrome B [Zetaproteobacteria bacterium CG17_big_fil_post_rev_8_21_14_2_50_50_13]PIV31137.1 MAG: cytochrome B [Zetaproteobacteria bacterium CG02_land_8_20_14_3_00_50_9]PIY56124.1 MAG: cytochrome B [Zetaproteobacteria bacterium CG_4_10_14_0_8_um_filter_49_80]PJA35905.1 MAG: cytochrome B [Zetaproteobacteria bacterium CG_4_9_14_3_um_filter_49_83]